jgi:hypothetical protein
MPRTATIGPAVYKRVNELVAEGKNRTEAFATVAQERKMNAGTVAANFYRTARTQGTSKPRRARAKTTRRTATTARKPQTRRAPARTSSGSAATPNGDLGSLAAQIGVLVQQLVRQVEERDRRLRELLG